jgi:hypothetical protein
MLSIFVPAYNEGERLGKNIKEVVSSLEGLDYELYIVDDGSTDETGEVGKRLAAENERISCIRYDNGPSRRENLAISFKKAGGDYIGFIDADLSASPEYFPEMISKIGEYDIIVGSRYVPGSETQRETSRLLVSKAYNIFIRLYFGSKIQDHQCGLKLFRRDVILDLVEESGYDDKRLRNFSWDAEILLRAQRKGLKILELPVKWVRSDKTSTRILRDMRMIPYLLGLRFRL